jgi:PAS domain S-box-containing protein
MNYQDKTKKELIGELEFLRAELAKMNNTTSFCGNEGLHHNLISKLPDLVFVHVHGIIVFVNDAVAAVTGYAPEEVIGKMIYEFISGKEKDTIREITNKRYSHQSPPDTYETKILHKNGSTLDVEIRVLTIDHEGKEARLVVVTDISQRKKLAAVEERFKNLADILPETIYETDIQGNLTYVNSTGFLKFGYEPEDLERGINIKDLFSAEEFIKVLERRSKILNQNNIHQTEFIAKKKDGTEFPVIFHTVTIYENGNAAGTRGIVIDITERKLAEKALLMNQRRLETLLALSHMSSSSLKDMVCYLLDTGINLIESPKLFIAIIDETNGTLSMFSRRRNGKDIISGEHYYTAKEISEWRHLFQEQKLLLMNEIDQSRIPCLPEQCRPLVRQILMPVFDENNFVAMAGIGDKIIPYVTADVLQLNLFMGEFSHIIHHRLQEDAILAERERLMVTLRSIGEGMISTDHGGIIMLMNHAAERITGWLFADLKEKQIDDYFILQYDDSELYVPSLMKSLTMSNRKTLLFNDICLIHKNGDKIPIEASAAPLIDRKNAITGAVIVFRDVTDKKRNEEIRLRSIKLESVGILAGGIAHDFNNVLTSILGNISLSRSIIDKTDEIHDLLLAAEKSAYRAKGLSQQLLTLAKGGEPVKNTSSISDLIRDYATFVIRGSNVACEFEIPEGFPPVEIDEGQIQQVLNNLIINAIQAMPSGGTITISGDIQYLEPTNPFFLESGDYVRISITDTGVGIAPENLHRIFDPYFTTKEKGHGLGLATTFSIIKKHNGYIDAASSQGKTTFTFYLPAKVEDDKNHIGKTVIKNSKGGKILVLEDESSIIEFLKKFFEQYGYEHVITTDGEKTIAEYKTAMIEKNPFDIVLLDLTIPGGAGGKQTIAMLKIIDPNVKAIVSSGYSNDSMIAEYHDFGFMERLTKPYLIEELDAILKKVISSE